VNGQFFPHCEAEMPTIMKNEAFGLVVVSKPVLEVGSSFFCIDGQRLLDFHTEFYGATHGVSYGTTSDHTLIVGTTGSK
jgi:hypothetical protein